MSEYTCSWSLSRQVGCHFPRAQSPPAARTWQPLAKDGVHELQALPRPPMHLLQIKTPMKRCFRVTGNGTAPCQVSQASLSSQLQTLFCLEMRGRLHQC